MSLEELHRAFMRLGGFGRLKGAQVSPFAAFRVLLTGIEAIFAGFEFANHVRSGSIPD